MTKQGPYTSLLTQRRAETRAFARRTQPATEQLLKWRSAVEEAQARVDDALGRVYEASRPLVRDDSVPSPDKASAAAAEALRRMGPLRQHQAVLEQFSAHAKTHFLALRTKAPMGAAMISAPADPHGDRGRLYGLLHQQHASTHQHQELAQIDDAEAHFADLGEQTARTVEHDAQVRTARIHENMNGYDTEHYEPSKDVGEPTRSTLDQIERDVLNYFTADRHGDAHHELSSLEMYALTCDIKVTASDLPDVDLARPLDTDEIEQALRRVVDDPSSTQAINELADSPLRSEHEYRQWLATSAPQSIVENTGWPRIAHLDQMCSRVNAATEASPQVAEVQQMRAMSFPVDVRNDQMRQASSAPRATERANVQAQSAPRGFDLGY